MKATDFKLVRYDADDNKVFDWVEPRYTDILDENGLVVDKVQEHLYAKTLFIGINDDISNYVEVDAPTKED